MESQLDRLVVVTSSDKERRTQERAPESSGCNRRAAVEFCCFCNQVRCLERFCRDPARSTQNPYEFSWPTMGEASSAQLPPHGTVER